MKKKHTRSICTNEAKGEKGKEILEILSFKTTNNNNATILQNVSQ